jgi:GNAT superfamily N-acetyltransferase
VGDLRCLHSRNGARQTLRRAAERAISALYWKADDILLLKALADVVPPTAGRQLRVEAAQLHHIPLLEDLNRRRCHSRREGVFAARLKAGAGAFLGFLDGELMGYLWWADARSVEDAEPRFARYGVVLGGDDVYGFDLFLAPECRGQGTASGFLARVESELHRLGYGRMWSYVDSENLPARWLLGISGHEPAGRVETRVLLSRFPRVDVKRRPARPD